MGRSTKAGAGAAAAPAGAAAAGAPPVAGAAPPPTALTAFWQLGESFGMLFCKHCNDASPPGGTLAQFF